MLGAIGAASAETLRVGKAGREAFSFVPADVGARTGMFKQHGVEIEISSFGGDARLQQAMAADGIDVALGSGPGLAFIVKGSPVKGHRRHGGAAAAVCAGGPQRRLVNGADDLKGRKVGVSTVGSVTSWIISEVARQKGWGYDGMSQVPIGDDANRIAALKTKSIDAAIVNLAQALNFVQRGDGKVLLRFGDLVKDFHIHVIFATDKAIAQKPEALKGFLAGWFETIAFMRRNKAETIEIAREVMGTDAQTTERHLRRADADVFGYRPVRSQGAGGAAQVLRRDEDARRRARHGQALYRSIPADELTEDRMTSDTMAIRIRGVSHQFGEEGDARHVRALRDTSLDIARGELLCLIGPSGCGKSTLLNVLGGLMVPTTGTVEVSGKRVAGPMPRDIAFVFQENALFPWNTVFENVNLGMVFQGVPRTEREGRARRSLEAVGLEDFAQHYPGQLSGGMRQRAALARALSLETGILLMDEPFGALDEQTRMILGEDLSVLLSRTDKTIVFVTHSLGEATFLADRVAVFSARPGTIKKIIKVDEPHPRNPDFVTSSKFTAIRNELYALLHDEIRKTMAETGVGAAAEPAP